MQNILKVKQAKTNSFKIVLTTACKGSYLRRG